MIGSGTSEGNIEIEQVQVVALYDSRTGSIRHIHTVTTLAGAPRTHHEDAIAGAKAYAARRHSNVDQLAVALSNDVEHARHPHYVDPKTGTFVPGNAPSTDVPR
jgi:hypothetical protein